MSHFRGVAAVLALVLGGALFVSFTWKPAPPAQVAALASADVPASVAGYTTTGDHAPDEYTRQALPGADILARTYRQGETAINFLLVSGTHGVALHDPRLCMGSMLLSAPVTEHLPGTPVKMQVYHASSHPGSPPDLLIAYFYDTDGRIISDPSEIRTAMLWGDLMGRQSAPVYFFRFILPLGNDIDSTERNHAQLQAFATQMWQAVEPKLKTTVKS